MWGVDALGLARVQFAFTIAFHVVFPAFSIGLASYLAVLNALHLRTGQAIYLGLFDYWKTIFAVGFGMGVVSGLVMSYQFGTNWSVFSDRTGPVIGPLMAYEVLGAFFLEAGFLGVMLFGRSKGRPGAAFRRHADGGDRHARVGLLDPQRQLLDADAGRLCRQRRRPVRAGGLVGGRLQPVLPLPVLAAYLTTALVVGAVGAWHLLRDPAEAGSRRMFAMAMGMIVVVAPLQILAGDQHGLNTLEHQPAKVAAMEGHYATRRGAPLILFGLPDDAAEAMRYAVEIPRLGSLILTHSLDGEVLGLKAFPPDERPKAAIVFWTFRLMVGLGFAMLGLGAWATWRRWRGRPYDDRWLLRATVFMGPMGFVALLAGWITTEVGRQPWTVYGLMRTADSVSPIETPAVASSLTAFVLVYVAVFGAGVFYLLRLLHRPPDACHRIAEIGVTRTAGIMPGPAAGPDPVE